MKASQIALAGLLTFMAAMALIGAVNTVSARVGIAAYRSPTITHKQKKMVTPAPIKMKLLGEAASPLLTDGARWAAYEPTVGVTRILDEAGGSWTNRLAPRTCAGGMEGIGGGQVEYRCMVADCPRGTEKRVCFPHSEERHTYFEELRYVMLNLDDGNSREVAGVSHLSLETPFPVELEAYELTDSVGSQWIVGWKKSSLWDELAFGTRFFLNWHTGQILPESEEPADADRQYEDLNAERLLQPLCKPLARRPAEVENPHGGGEQYLSPLYRPPFAIGRMNKLGGAELRRCGTNRHVALPRGYCGEGSASGGEVGVSVLSCEGCIGRRALAICGGFVTRLFARRYPWHGPIYRLVGLPKQAAPLCERGPSSVVNHTLSMVFVSKQLPSCRYRVYAAWLPWVPAEIRGAASRVQRHRDR